MKNKIFIIAEAGINHNGDISLAYKLVDAAAAAKADGVKFQTFQTEALVNQTAPKADYQQKTTSDSESQYDMLKKLELDLDAHRKLFSYCTDKGIQFLSSPFDLESIDLLNELGLKVFKIPSGEITNLPYLEKMGSLKKKVIMSTGMAEMEEIEAALITLTKAGTLKENITVLHCNSEYPTPFKDVHLSAMLTIKDTLDVTVGYSDHTSGIEIPIAAAALGARVIEKHLTLDRSMQGPDHAASLEPDELQRMVASIRNIEKALGDGDKKISPSEVKNKSVVRKSLIAAKDIKKGEKITEDMLVIKRPGTGISPMHYYETLGKEVKRDVEKDALLEWNDF